MTLIIRQAKEQDLADIRRVLVETWHFSFVKFYGLETVTKLTDRWHSIDALRKNLEQENAYLDVAEQDGIIVGTSFAIFEHGTQKVKLSRIYVLPNAHRQGVGQAMLDHILEKFREAKAVHLEVEPKNDKAIAFYKKNKFEIVGEGNYCGDYGESIPHLIMERSLEL